MTRNALLMVLAAVLISLPTAARAAMVTYDFENLTLNANLGGQDGWTVFDGISTAVPVKTTNTGVNQTQFLETQDTNLRAGGRVNGGGFVYTVDFTSTHWVVD